MFVPVLEKFTTSKLPWVSLALSLSLILSYMFFQLDDKAAREKAYFYYFDTELSQIELPAYIAFAQKHMANPNYFNFLQKVKNQSLSQQTLYLTQLWDPIFQRELQNGQIITSEYPKALQWRQLRREFELILSQDHALNYGFKTAQPSWTQGLSFFFQGGLTGLIGAVFFLLFAGSVLERHIGYGRFIASVVLIQGLSLSLHALLYPFSLMPLMGADAVAAGLVGIYVIRLGGTKVGYWLLIPPLRVVHLPAFMAMGIWFIWLGLNHSFSLQPLYSLSASLGGLCLGLMLGFLLKKTNKKALKREVVEAQDYQSFQARYHDALNKLADFNLPQAKKAFYSLHKEFPQNQEILFQLFNTTKHDPASEDYHLVVAKILSLKDNSRGCVSMMNIVFQNYIRGAQPSIRFDPNTFLSLMQKFRRYGYLEDAEKILKVLVQYNKKGRLNEVLAREQLLLVRAFMNKQDDLKAEKTLQWCQSLYPETASAKEARMLQLKKAK